MPGFVMPEQGSLLLCTRQGDAEIVVAVLSGNCRRRYRTQEVGHITFRQALSLNAIKSNAYFGDRDRSFRLIVTGDFG